MIYDFLLVKKATFDLVECSVKFLVESLEYFVANEEHVFTKFFWSNVDQFFVHFSRLCVFGRANLECDFATTLAL